ncbi:conserved hypothetical protein [Stigmatella aurantiaca DW4/3-1]|uniref:Uncharacterized protein n=1 Tax=Stigmatella aurantiaca (strain DW4/3-1) TaxID=378806 RepID=Q08YP5_STIAD|nr:conserved hypothetical protein [Stigmatella aurantiaca DW4/3-1]
MKLRGDTAAAHHRDAVADAHDLGQLTGDDDERDALLGQPIEHIVDLALGPDVDSPRGLVDDEDLDALLGQPAGQNDLLLVAARQVLDGLLARRGPHPQALDERLGHLAFPAGVHDAEGREVAARGDGDVLLHRLALEDAIGLAVLRAEHEARAHRLPGMVDLDRHPVDAQLACAALVGAIQEPRQLAAAGAHQPEEAENLPGANLEARRGRQARALQPRDGEPHRAGRAGPPAPDVLDLPAHHLPHQHLARQPLQGVVLGHQPAITQHDAAIAQAEDLIQPVGDIQDDLAGRAQPFHQPEEHLALMGGERGGGLVQGNDRGVEDGGLGNLHHLPGAQRQIGHLGLGVHLDADLPQHRADLGEQFLEADDPEPGGKAAQHEVLGHRQLRHELKLLVDDGHPGGDRIARRDEALRLSTDAQLTALGGVIPPENLDERGLARAVLAQQTDDPPRRNREAQFLEGPDAREALGDVRELEKRSHTPPRQERLLEAEILAHRLVGFTGRQLAGGQNELLRLLVRRDPVVHVDRRLIPMTLRRDDDTAVEPCRAGLLELVDGRIRAANAHGDHIRGLQPRRLGRPDGPEHRLIIEPERHPLLDIGILVEDDVGCIQRRFRVGLALGRIEDVRRHETILFQHRDSAFDAVLRGGKLIIGHADGSHFFHIPTTRLDLIDDGLPHGLADLGG